MKNFLAPNGYIWISVPNAAYSIARSLKGYWHGTDIPLHLMQFTPKSIAVAGEHADLRVIGQSTDSPEAAVSLSVRQYLKHKFKVPQRFSERLPLLENYSRHLARKLDANMRGEAIITRLAS
jgi:hypothetical protein